MRIEKHVVVIGSMWICIAMLVSFTFAQSADPQTKDPATPSSSQASQKPTSQPASAKPDVTSDAPASGGCVARSARLGNAPCNNPEPATLTSQPDTALEPVASALPSAAEIKQSNELYKQAVELETNGDFDLALDVMDQSLKLDPANLKHQFAREYTKQELISSHIHIGDEELANGNIVLAAAQYRIALAADPQDPTTISRMKNAFESNLKNNQDVRAEEAELSEDPILDPLPVKKELHYRGDTRGIYEQIGKLFGISMQYDIVPSKNVTIDTDAVDFWKAMFIAGKMTHTFFTVEDIKAVKVAEDSQDVRRRTEHHSLKTFDVPTTDDKDLDELKNLFRTTFDLRFIETNKVDKTMTVRAPRRTLDTIGRILNALSAGQPDVVLEFDVIEVNSTFSRNLGLKLPLQYSIFNVNTEAAALLASAQGNPLLQQLQNSGASVATLAGAAALLAATSSSPLLGPFVTIGGGTTLTGIGLPALTTNFGYNASSLKSLSHFVVRAEAGGSATFRIGDRYPVLTESFSYNSIPGVTLPTNAGSFTQVPGFQYVDLGITLTVKPSVDIENTVRMDVDLGIKALSGTAFNGVPVVSNREYKSVISIKNDTAAVVLGNINETEMNAIQGLPLLSKIPLIGALTSTRDRERNSSNMLIIMIPHVVRAGKLGIRPTEIYLDSN